MKLTKQKLKEIFEWAKLFCDLSYGDGNRNVAGVIKGLKDDTLEIEGYIRADHFADADKKVSWTKFDPNYPLATAPEAAANGGKITMRIYGEIKGDNSRPPCVVLIGRYYYLVTKIEASCDAAMVYNGELFGLTQIGDWLCELPSETEDTE